MMKGSAMSMGQDGKSNFSDLVGEDEITAYCEAPFLREPEEDETESDERIPLDQLKELAYKGLALCPMKPSTMREVIVPRQPWINILHVLNVLVREGRAEYIGDATYQRKEKK